MARSLLCVVLAACLMANAFCAPSPLWRFRRDQYKPYRSDLEDDDLSPSSSKSSSTYSPFDDDDDDDDFAPAQTTSGGGSNIFSLLNLATALFPSSSGGVNRAIRGMVRQYLLKHQQQVDIGKRQDVSQNTIDVDYVKNLTPPFQRQEEEEHDSGSHDDDDDDDDSESEEEQNDAAEESVEKNKEDETDKASKQDNGNASAEDSDYSEEPEGDGQGGGILGLLAGLSGGEDGSDLGTLLATVSQIVGNLSGDGFDLNALIGSAFGLFVGLLSQGEENPGEVIASYLLTSLDTITGGGAENNGAYFGKFISTLLKGVSAADDEEDGSSEEGKMKMPDSTSFFVSLLMSLSGDMSKTSSSGSSKPW